MAYFIYILRCNDNSLYTGSTTDVNRRFKEHTLGKGGAYTRSRLPVKLVYMESHKNRSAAQKREALIKSWPRVQKQHLVKTGKP